jgi:formiminotetrahydrofolate cyclodeaminase
MEVSPDRSLAELLEAVAAPTPAPGAGTTSAWTAALAAGLVEMCAALTLSRGELAGVHGRMELVRERAAELRGVAVALGQVELVSYGPVLEERRRPREDPGRAAAVAAALSDAAKSPLEVARVSAELAELAAEVVRDGNPNVVGDAAAGAELAAAACLAAARLVRINLEAAARQTSGGGGEAADGLELAADRLDEADVLVARAAAARASLDAPRP